jgi:hypothetical protein
MNEKVKILFFCMIFVGGSAFAQKSATFITINKAYFIALKKQNSGGVKHTEAIKTTTTPVFSIHQSGSYSIINSNFYTQNFGFFCKKELQIEKTIKFPLKFRLGSVQQCDWMEGKVNAVRSN